MAAKRLSAWKIPNSVRAEEVLVDLESEGVDVSDARVSLLEYKNLKRPDYSSAEDYSEDRSENWTAFLDELSTAEKRKGAAQAVTPLLATEAKLPPASSLELPTVLEEKVLGSIVPVSPETAAHMQVVEEAWKALEVKLAPKARKPRAKAAAGGAEPPSVPPPVAVEPPAGPPSFPPGFKPPTEELLKFARDNKLPEDMLRFAQGQAAERVPELRDIQKLLNPLRAFVDPVRQYRPGVQSAYLWMERLMSTDRQRVNGVMLAVTRMFREAGATKESIVGARAPELAKVFTGAATDAERPYIGTIAHMLENSERYGLTPRWKRAVQEWKTIFDNDLHVTQGMGIKAGEVEGVYVPHRYTDPKAAEAAVARWTGGRGKPSVLKKRTNITPQETYQFAQENDLQVKTDILSLGYWRLLSTARLRSEIVFGDGLVAQFGGKRYAGIHGAGIGRGNFTRGGMSWDLPQEIAGEAERALAPLNEDNLSGLMNQATNNMKSALLTLDFSVGGAIQGMLGFMADPVGAVQAYKAAWRAATTADGEALWLSQNIAEMLDANLHGLNLGVSPLDLPVKLLGEKPTLVQRLPGVSQLENVQFKNIMPKLKLALYRRNLSMLLALQQDRNLAGIIQKAPGIGPVAKRLSGNIERMGLEELKDAAADGASNWLGGVERARWSSQRLGTLRNLLVLTESWTRAQVGIVVNAPKLSPKGMLARRMLMQEMAIGLGIAEAVNLITGHDTILDSRSSKFGSVWTPFGYVKVIPHAPLLRIVSRVVAGTPEGEFGGGKGALDQRLSALLSWTEARGGQAPHLIVDLASGRDFYGRAIDNKALYVAQQLAPIPAQNAMERFGRPESLWVKLGQAAIGLTGANVSFVPVREQLTELAQQMGVGGKGEKFEKLARPKQVQVETSPEGRVISAAAGATVSWQQKAIRIKFRDEQLARDEDVLQAKLLPQDWVDAWYNGKVTEAARIEQFRADHPREFAKPRTLGEEALKGYYDLMMVFRDPRTGMFDKEGWAEGEKVYLEALPTPIRAEVEEELHPYDTPLVTRFRQDRKRLDFYFSVRDAYLKSHPLAAQLQKEAERAVLARDPRRVEMLKRHPAMRQMEKDVGERKEMLRQRYPDMDATLRFWGYVSTSKTRGAEGLWVQMLGQLQPKEQEPVVAK